jgi:hypothetical protein
MIPVEGHKGLYRDEISGGIVNCNDNEYEDYMKLKNKKILEKQEINTLKNEIENLKSLLKDVINSKA